MGCMLGASKWGVNTSPLLQAFDALVTIYVISIQLIVHVYH